MEKIKKDIVSKLSLIISKDFDTSIYQISKKRYLLFWEEDIDKNNVNKCLEKIDSIYNSFGKYKLIIVVGKTSESFTKTELFYFNNIDTFVVFYLLDFSNKKVYMNDRSIFVLGLNYKKTIKKLNKIIKFKQ
ncbi:MAG: hypothetical protein GX312_01795 [Candidatus Phytoplasma sp.]|nr:hypothetical protein [Phytoplasma sp.]